MSHEDLMAAAAPAPRPHSVGVGGRGWDGRQCAFMAGKKGKEIPEKKNKKAVKSTEAHCCHPGKNRTHCRVKVNVIVL